jgi:hypothetical protein
MNNLFSAFSRVSVFLFLISSMHISYGQSGLIGCYPLDNNANDFSGNNYNGTIQNLTSVPDRFGNPNGAFHFSGLNSFIDLPYADFLLDTFTYSAWCRPTSLPASGGYYSILSIGGVMADQAILLSNDAPNGNVGFGAASWASDISPHTCSSGTLPTSNQWYHIVMTRTNTLLTFYVNDSLICSAVVANLTAGYLNTNTASIGTRAGTTGQDFVGDIDDVRIYNRVLSLNEIKSISPACQSADTTCLIACYPLNNNTTDQSGHNYNGTGTNVTATSDHFGNPNSAFHFSGINSYIDLPYSAFLLDTFTYSAWCRLTNIPSAGNYYSILSIGGADADQAILVGNDAVNGTVGFTTASWAANITSHSCSTGMLPAINQWYHVVVTRTNFSSNLYVNDTLICSATVPGLSAGYQNNLSALIGSRAATSGQNFKGDIDDVRIFNCALSLSEIKTLGNSCSATAVNEFQANDNLIFIYPNPLTLSSTLQLKAELRNAEISIYDLFGKEKMQRKFSGNTIEIEKGSLANGIYFVKVSNDKIRAICKLLVQ